MIIPPPPKIRINSNPRRNGHPRHLGTDWTVSAPQRRPNHVFVGNIPGCLLWVQKRGLVGQARIVPQTIFRGPEEAFCREGSAAALCESGTEPDPHSPTCPDMELAHVCNEDGFEGKPTPKTGGKQGAVGEMGDWNSSQDSTPTRRPVPIFALQESVQEA
ncbi:hypothetical protein SKAU_G00222160 [Synaphobranchus kaupii]|uniref:Uncharacterized protein n=1 Tax=Synaphobranchus kaupii TaxID=118154 RepID=A0A9Q1IVL5_SYNKA|nr:hypothetical protein SKAU_G00222160 [Synaphobranchus kaupii]